MTADMPMTIGGSKPVTAKANAMAISAPPTVPEPTRAMRISAEALPASPRSLICQLVAAAFDNERPTPPMAAHAIQTHGVVANHHPNNGTSSSPTPTRTLVAGDRL